MSDLNKLTQHIKEELPGDYNLLIHGVSQEGRFDETTAEQINSEGLKCNYMTMFRTTRELGRVDDLTPDKLDYAYLSRDNDRSLDVLLAIPDYLVSQGQILPIFPQDQRMIDKHLDDGGYRCVMDIILHLSQKEGMVIPREFVYGDYVFEHGSNKATFKLNEHHISKLDDKQRQEFVQRWKQSIEQSNLEYLIVDTTNPDQNFEKYAKLMNSLSQDSEVTDSAIAKLLSAKQKIQKDQLP